MTAEPNYIEAARARLLEVYPRLGERPERDDLYLLLVLIKGESVTLEDVHDAWSVWCARANPGHPSIVPFGDLSLEVQELDRKYMERIAAAAKVRD